MHELIIKTPQDLISGCIRIVHDGTALFELDILAESIETRSAQSHFEQMLMDAFDDYFSRSAQSFAFPVRLHGSDFQHRVWHALQQIPAGNVLSYGELAEKLNSSARAVGNACRKNPLPIIVPCHRVVAKAGIGGFAGQTQGPLVEQKRRLLRHEGIRL